MTGITVLREVNVSNLLRAGKLVAFRKATGPPMLCNADEWPLVQLRFPSAVAMTVEDYDEAMRKIVNEAME